MDVQPYEYIPGDFYRTCMRCGFRARRSTTRREWTNLIVCLPCLDPYPPDMRPPNVWPEGVPVKDASPDPTPVYVADNEVQPEDLP